MPTRDPEQDLKVVEAFWPALASDELNDLLAELPSVGAFERIVQVSGRPLSAAALVQASRSLVFVKRHDMRVRPCEDVAQEHALIAHLIHREVKTPRAIGLMTRGRWVYEIFEAADGEDRYRERHTWSGLLQFEHAQALGRALGRLHRAAEDGPAIRRGSPYQRLALEEVNVPEGLPELPLHGDPQANNFFWSGEDVAAVIDFHLAETGPRLLDLAVALDRNGIFWLQILAGDDTAYDLVGMAGIVEGYRHEVELTRAELAALPELLVRHRIGFARTLGRYYAEIEGSPERAAWCRDVFERAHLAWFDSPPGQKLLRALSAAVG